jgi:hypothetical protein
MEIEDIMPLGKLGQKRFLRTRPANQADVKKASLEKVSDVGF